MVPYERLKRILSETGDQTERKIRFVALLTSSLPKSKLKPILVGDSAMEVYLDGVLRTGDMDIVYDSKALALLLERWHFKRGGMRTWVNVELGLAVDAVGAELSGSYERTTTITTNHGPATIIGVEDLILMRLASAKHWRVPTDMEQAYLLAKAHEDRIDWKYVEEKAGESGVPDYFKRLMSMLKGKERGNSSR